MYRCHKPSKSCRLVCPNLHKPPLQSQDARFVLVSIFTVRIFTDLIVHNYRSNQSALMTRCGTDFRHQYGIFGGESQTSFTRNATRVGSEEGRLFSQARVERFISFVSITTNIHWRGTGFRQKFEIMTTE